MFEEIISQSAKKSLALLGQNSFFKKTYLAGGTALALQLGHRESKDFDFFTKEKFDAKTLAKILAHQVKNFKEEKTSWGTILANIGRTKFSLFFYDYPLLFKAKTFSGIRVADPKDIAAMKIASIADRGKKRDFIDLYFLLKMNIASLTGCLELYDRKFGKLSTNKAHILKSLIYFADAELEKMPHMFKPASWKEIKRFFRQEIKQLTHQLLTNSKIL